MRHLVNSFLLKRISEYIIHKSFETEDFYENKILPKGIFIKGDIYAYTDFCVNAYSIDAETVSINIKFLNKNLSEATIRVPTSFFRVNTLIHEDAYIKIIEAFNDNLFKIYQERSVRDYTI